MQPERNPEAAPVIRRWYEGDREAVRPCVEAAFALHAERIVVTRLVDRVDAPRYRVDVYLAPYRLTPDYNQQEMARAAR
jgi:hypothetical protein